MLPENLNVPNTPNRSRLYYLEPIATATPYVEGLISYICRLAEAHGVSPGILLKKAVIPTFREHYSIGIDAIYLLQKNGHEVLVSSIPKPPYRKNPNEYGLLAWQYIEGLKLLTLRQELQTLIIPAEASKFLPEVAGSDAARNLRAWCPACFHEWRTSNQPLYEPLLWSLSIVTICPIHHKLLQLRCPHCQKSQLPLTARTLVARCSQCFA